MEHIEAVVPEEDPYAAQARIRRGAKFLDEHVSGWWKTGRFSLADFSLQNGCRCVVAQVFARQPDAPEEADYDYAIETGWLDLDCPAAVEYGFVVTVGEPVRRPDSDVRIEYATLENEWRDLITIRRENGPDGARYTHAG